MQLAYDLHSLPGGPERRFELARRLGLALELRYREERGLDPPGGLPVAAVQAYDLHRLHPLHPVPEARRLGLDHARAALDAAARSGAAALVVVPGYGHHLADHPRERVLDFLGELARRAEGLGIELRVEQLGPSRLSILNQPGELAELLDELGEPAAGLLLDTGHLLDAGVEPTTAFQRWRRQLRAVHLKGPGSRPPVAAELRAWLPALPPVACLTFEHRQRDEAVEERVALARRLLGLS